MSALSCHTYHALPLDLQALDRLGTLKYLEVLEARSGPLQGASLSD